MIPLTAIGHQLQKVVSVLRTALKTAVVIGQHMPPLFRYAGPTIERKSKIPVHAARKSGDRTAASLFSIGRRTSRADFFGRKIYAQLRKAQPVVDVLFRSVASVYQLTPLKNERSSSSLVPSRIANYS